MCPRLGAENHIMLCVMIGVSAKVVGSLFNKKHELSQAGVEVGGIECTVTVDLEVHLVDQGLITVQ